MTEVIFLGRTGNLGFMFLEASARNLNVCKTRFLPSAEMTKLSYSAEVYGNLPKGVHLASLDEIKEVLGSSSARRKWLIERLEKIVELAKSTGKLERIFV